jgi:hypothetical protein
MDESVLSAFRRSTTIQRLFTSNITTQFRQEVENGPVYDIMKRNRVISHAIELLESESQWTIPFYKFIERITRPNDNTGATAVYKIMQEKLVMWWAPHQAAVSTVDAPIAPAAAAAAAASSVAALGSSISDTTRGRRSRTQHGNGAFPTNETKETTTRTALEPLARKRTRHSS